MLASDIWRDFWLYLRDNIYHRREKGAVSASHRQREICRHLPSFSLSQTYAHSSISLLLGEQRRQSARATVLTLPAVDKSVWVAPACSLPAPVSQAQCCNQWEVLQVPCQSSSHPQPEWLTAVPLRACGQSSVGPFWMMSQSHGFSCGHALRQRRSCAGQLLLRQQ